MRLARIAGGERPVVAVIARDGNSFRPLAALVKDLPAAARTDMAAAIGFLAGRALGSPPTENGQPLKGTRLLAPLPNPPHGVLCVGKNYRAHAREFARSGYDTGTAAAVPECPVIFNKPASAIVDPEAAIPLWPGLDEAVDYEAELAVVIGRGGRSIPRAEAMAHVFGYTIVNDVTARDVQRRHQQWLLGKGADGFCPMGPWIVTVDSVNGGDLSISCRVNGERRQDARTADLIFDIPELIAIISRSMALLPGDVIATGTPEGVGIGFNPPRFLREGDVVEVEVSGIGRLRNGVRRMTFADAATPRQQPARVT